MRIGVVLIGILLLTPAAYAQQPAPVDPSSQTLVGPFLVRDLLKLLDEDPLLAGAMRDGVSATAIRAAGERGRQEAFSLVSSWASVRSATARQTASRDARSAWHSTYMRMMWRSIRR